MFIGVTCVLLFLWFCTIQIACNIFYLFKDGSLVDDLENIPPIPLIDAIIPEALAQRAATLYRNVAEKTDLAKSLAFSPTDIDVEESRDGVLVLRGHQKEVSGYLELHIN